MGILLGHKLTKKDTPKENEADVTPTVTPTIAPTATPTVAEEKTLKNGRWLLSKEYYSKNGEDFPGTEFSYDEQGRLTQKTVYNKDGSVNRHYSYDEQERLTQMTSYKDDGSVDQTEYYSYGVNGKRAELWEPDKGGECKTITITDIGRKEYTVDLWGYETYEEEFYEDGYIKELRTYWKESEYSGGPRNQKILEQKITWEYDPERNTRRRKIYDYREYPEGSIPLSDEQFELDADGRIVKCIGLGDDVNGSKFEVVYKYEGKRCFAYKTSEDGWMEWTWNDWEVWDVVEYKDVRADGSEISWETFWPNVNSFPEGLKFPRMTVEKRVESDGTESVTGRIQFGADGQPVRLIDSETGAILMEYEYSSDGKLIGVLEGGDDTPLKKVLNIQMDQYGNLVECTPIVGYKWGNGSTIRWEWIFVPDQEQ